MKYGLFIVLLAATVPAGALLRRNRWLASKAWMLIGFLPFVIQPLHQNMALFSSNGWTIQSFVTYDVAHNIEWPGYVHAMEISVLDVLALALYATLPKARHPLAFKLSMAFYFFATAISVLQAPTPVGTFFYLWQLARMFLVYAVIARASAADLGVATAVLQGMAAGVLMEFGLAFWQRLESGVTQTPGSFSHQNLLGIMIDLVCFPFFAILLVGQRMWLAATVTLTTVLVAILTVSRATLAMTVAGIVFVFVVSVLRRWTPQKNLYLLVGILALIIVSPFAFRSLEDRFGIGQSFDPSYEYNDRLALERAAGLILSDHPFGVGANNYILVAINEGYDRAAGVALAPANLLEEVHNAYWLVAAECGYLGLVAFVLFLVRPLAVALDCSWRHRGDQRGDLLLGLGVSLLALYIHSLWEWVFVDYQVQYMFAMTVGMIAGLAQQLGYWKPAYAKAVRCRLARLPIRALAAGGISARSISQRRSQVIAQKYAAIQAPAAERPKLDKELLHKLKMLHLRLSNEWERMFPPPK